MPLDFARWAYSGYNTVFTTKTGGYLPPFFFGRLIFDFVALPAPAGPLLELDRAHARGIAANC